MINSIAHMKSSHHRFFNKFLAATLACFSLAPSLAEASSEDTWEEFRSDVKRSCTKASSDLVIKSIDIDDFGTESYGFSIISGKPKSGRGIQQLRVCVYDKKSKTSEILEIGNLEKIKSLMTDSPEPR